MRWTLLVKAKLLAVLVAAAALFATVDYSAVRLVDPHGPFILANVSSQAWAVTVLAGSLAAITIAGSLLLCRDIPAVHWLIAGAAWAGVALRSWPIDARLIYLTDPESLRGLYGRLLAEFALLASITALIAIIAGWIASLIPARRGETEEAKAAAELADTDISPADGIAGVTDEWAVLLAQVLGMAGAAVLLYLMLVSHSPTHGTMTGQIRRGQVEFAIIAASMLAAFGAHQLFPTRKAWRLLLGVALLALLCYVLTMAVQGGPRFAYQSPTRLGVLLPIDFLGLAMPSAIGGYIISFRIVQLRRAHARQAAEAAK